MDLIFYANGSITRVTATVVSASPRKELPNGTTKYEIAYREIGTDHTRYIYPVVARLPDIVDLMVAEWDVVDLTEHTFNRGVSEGANRTPRSKL